MNPSEKQKIGTNGLEVTLMGLGGAAFGNIYAAIEDHSAVDAMASAYRLGVRYFDTAPLYGFSLSETRLGAALPEFPRDEIVISTKVGWTLVDRQPDDPPVESFVDTPPLKAVMDFSYDGVMRSIEASLNRLHCDRIDIVYIHDPDESISIQPDFDPYGVSHFAQVMDEVYPALDKLRTDGAIKAIGVGMNQWQMLRDFVNEGEFDCFLLAGRYTLLEQEPLDELLPLCQEKSIRIVIGGPYNSGILATGAVENTHYNYAPATKEILDRTRSIEEVCGEHGVSLQAAALQFPFGHPSVATVIPGARSASEVEANVEFFQEAIPADFWNALKDRRLIRPDAPTPSES
jgi:D-threo-aldose 1-dehydrogenase